MARVQTKIIKRSQQSTLIEWIDKDNMYRRGFLPSDKVDDEGFVSSATQLSYAIPYGDDWESLIAIKATPASVANELRKSGIWTIHDLLANHRQARGAIHAAFALDYAALLRAARDSGKEQ